MFEPSADAAARTDSKADGPGAEGLSAPQISLPKGGGAIRGIGETFSANAVTGTATMTVPIATSPGRSGFGPALSLSYDSGSGNGPFGLGWSLDLPSITRRTDRGLPRYVDSAESDIFILSGSEDLVPALVQDAAGNWSPDAFTRDGYAVVRYRPRIEGLYARIERWTRVADGDTYWRSITRDNLTTYYGQTPESRVADPDRPSHVFTWLISASQDDRGNVVVYDYAAEDSSGVDTSRANERNRTASGRSANRYPKRVRYGNAPSRLVEPDLTKLSWLFEVVFDYGEGHYQAQPPDAQGRVFATATPTATTPWPVRQDPFSTYRAGFEVRTYRLCRRVLMFHHFPGELGTPDTLVSATEFAHTEGPVATLLASVTASGFVRQADGTYRVKSYPALEMEYSEAVVNPDVVDPDPDSLANLPSGAGSPSYRWLDLDGDGLQGVLAEQDGGWFYKRNLSALTFDAGDGTSPPTASALFDAVNAVNSLPGFATGDPGRHQFLDLGGDGRLDCVVLEPPAAGYYKRTQRGGWEPFRPLDRAPVVDWSNPDLRFVDLDGDGFPDVLITEDDVLTWYPSLAESGFGAGERVPRARDEERGPAVVFADSLQTVFLADMSGDGLSDVVRVRYGEVCYWPNLGYGCFGPMVAMDNAPWFEDAERFDARRVRLADIDGSGTADLIYLASDGVRLHSNQAGNSWGDPVPLPTFPRVDDLSDVQALDLLGNGTACLVWFSPLPGDARQAIRYVDLMGGRKPYLLVRFRNNLGAETRVAYSPSTKFSLLDRQAGTPWATRLPFPVQVVERVETDDAVSRTRSVSRYAYHHGSFDGLEREFRGFGMVEQRDTEELGVLTASGAFPGSTNIDAASYVPPVVTKTWFHTGAFPQGRAVSRVYDAESFSESNPSAGGLTRDQAESMRLPDSFLQADLTVDEFHEAVRALKGSILRREVYADDGTAAASRPYRVAERNYTVRRVQPLGGNRHAVFEAHARESLDFQYERALYAVGGRTLADPRVTHGFVFSVDDFGNPLLSASVGYGRRHDDPDPLLTPADRASQSALHATATVNVYTNPVLAADDYRTPALAQSRTFELIQVSPDRTAPDVTNLFLFDELAGKVAQAGDGLHDLPYEDFNATGATASHPYRRVISHSRMLYRKDDLTGPLPLGTVEPLSIPSRGFTLAFTPGLLGLFQRGAENLLPSPAAVLRDEGGYVLGDDMTALGLFPAGDTPGSYWVPSGQAFYSANASDPPAQELAAAQAHFFRPVRFRDRFGNDGTVSYDAHDLLVLETVDAVGNRVTAGDRAADGTVTSRLDYRVLAPGLTTDPNGNRTAAAFDALGRIAGTAVMGKSTESLGDSLAGFDADPTQPAIDQFFGDPKGPPAATLLGTATTRFVYDLDRFARSPATPTPAYSATIARETHAADLGPGQATRIQVGFVYSDGSGREIQRKAQTGAGPVTAGGPVVNPRWLATGWTVFNNKEKPVRRYEPFFDSTHEFAYGAAVGVSPTLFYDPAGRVVATLNPNHTWEKVVFDPWRNTTWDVNDTVLIADPKSDPDLGPYAARIPDADYLPTWYALRAGGGQGPDEQDAAQKAAGHANTPSTSFLDALGRAFLTVGFNRTRSGATTTEDHSRTLVTLDVSGNQRGVTDALGRTVLTRDFDVPGTAIRVSGVDAGERWMLNEAAGKPLRAWDSRGHTIRTTYDPLRRPTGLYVRNGGAEVLAEQTVYGEGQPGDQAMNLRGRIARRNDGAGVLSNDRFDFKGNLLAATVRLLQNSKAQVDWSLAPSPALEVESFATSNRYDALNRPLQLVAPASSAPGTRFDVIQYLYDESTRVNQVDAWRGQAAAPAGLLDPSTATDHTVTGIDYNAKSQRTAIAYGNGSTSTSTYEPDTFRLSTLTTTRASDGATLQALSYHYDPAGNVTRINDAAQQTLYFSNQVVAPATSFEYDALYRLTSASGREQVGLAAQPQTTFDDSPRMSLPLPSDGQAMRNYTEAYQYDSVDNLLSLAHTAAGGSWTRTYAYDEPNPTPTTNRLTSTTVGAQKETDSYDPHGNIVGMPHLSLMAWDFKDRLQATQKTVAAGGDGGTTYYVYDAEGRRARKVTESAAGVKTKERIYLGAVSEVYREFNPAGTVTLERATLHVMVGGRRAVIFETTTVDASAPPGSLPSSTARYQLDNHLGSAVLELDGNAAVISYEEYYPFGSTSFQAGRSAAEVGLKRYRFTGKERDGETGLYYHGARYCAPWLGRWVSCDPSGFVDGPNLYAYARNNPVRLRDPDGRQGDDDLNQVGTSHHTPDQAAAARAASAAAAAKPPAKVAKDDKGDDDKNTPPLGTSTKPGPIDYDLFNPPKLALKPDEPNLWLASVYQGIGTWDHPGGVEVEANLAGALSYGKGLGNPGLGGGLNTAALAIRKAASGTPDNQSFDVGTTGTFSYLSSGGFGAGRFPNAAAVAGTAHYGVKGESDWGFAAYGQANFGWMRSTTNNSWQGPAYGASGTLVLAKEPDEGDKYGVNLSGAYATQGQLTQGPTLRNPIAIGGTASYSTDVGAGDLALEGYGGYSSGGGSTAAGGTGQSGSAWHVGGGIGFSVSKVGPLTAIDAGTPANQTNSISFNLDYTYERGKIGSAQPVAPSAPGGEFSTHTLIFTVTFGFRKPPGD